MPPQTPQSGWFTFPGAKTYRSTLADADRLRRAGDYLPAIDSFRAALTLPRPRKVEPTDAWVGVIETLALIERFDDARAALADARAGVVSPCGTAMLLICDARLTLDTAGDPDEARKRAEEALAIAKRDSCAPAQFRALTLLADIALREDSAIYAKHLLENAFLAQKQKAAKADDAAVEKDADFPYMALWLGIMGSVQLALGADYEGETKLREALQIARDYHETPLLCRWLTVLIQHNLTLGRCDDAGEFADDLIAKTPPDAHARLAQAYVLRSLAGQCRGQFNSAIYDAEKAIALAESPIDKAQAQIALGDAMRANGFAAEALPILEAANAVLETIPARRALAHAVTAVGDHDRALALYHALLTDLEPVGDARTLARTLRDLGLLLYARRAYADAIQQWTRAITVFERLDAHADIARLYCDVANARLLMGARTRARQDIDQASMRLGKLPRHDLATRGVVLANAAAFLADQGDPDTTDSFFNEAIAIAEKTNDRRAEIIRVLNYGWFLLIAKRPRRAAVTLERGGMLARRDAPDLLPTALHHLAVLALGDNDPQTALARLEEAASLTDSAYWQALIHARLSTAHLRLGNAERAAAAIATARAAAQNADGDALLNVLIATATLHSATDAADVECREAVRLAREGGHRLLLASALVLYAGLLNRQGDADAADAAHAEAAAIQKSLHMPETYPPWRMTRSSAGTAPIPPPKM